MNRLPTTSPTLGTLQAPGFPAGRTAFETDQMPQVFVVARDDGAAGLWEAEFVASSQEIAEKYVLDKVEEYNAGRVEVGMPPSFKPDHWAITELVLNESK